MHRTLKQASPERSAGIRQVQSCCAVFGLGACLLVGCGAPARYTTTPTTYPSGSVFVDARPLGDDGPLFDKGYGAMLATCTDRLSRLDTEYGGIVKNTQTWRSVLLAVGAASGLFTTGYAVFEKEPDQKVVGIAGLFSTASLTGSFGFLTESERLAQLDKDAAEIAKRISFTEAAAGSLESSGRAWGRQDPPSKCDDYAKRCETRCNASCADGNCNEVCSAECATAWQQCQKNYQDAKTAFQEARTQFTAALRAAQQTCGVRR